ncbi:MAG TPA: ATP-binding protein [Chloroflexota bacterium]|nr:ATP-binding protein [Chloroflexota bacterium]
MIARRLGRLAPRRLRWRLVLGFVLTVALLQAVLIVAERVLVRDALVRSVQQNIEDTVRTGLAGPGFSQSLTKELMTLGSAGVVEKNSTSGASPGKVKATPSPPLSAAARQVFLAADVTSLLPSLTSSLALPDQPVAMVNGLGQVLTQIATLAGDRARPRPLAPTVLRSLLAAVVPRAANLTRACITQVSTADGPYLLLLWPTQEPVLDIQPTKGELTKVLSLLKDGEKDAPDPSAGALLQRLHPSPLLVLIARRLDDTQQTVDTVTAISLGGALAVMVVAALISMLVVGRALRPLSTITRGAERLARGDYRHRLALDAGADEVGRLATAFDRMASAIGAAFSNQRRFIADASHELRTPLTALRGYTDILLLGVGEDRATADRVLHAMQEDLGRMSRLVNDLLTLARLDGGAPLQWEPIDVAGLLDAAAQEGRAIARDRRRILHEPAPAGLAVRGDRDRLRQVLSNILGNACAYSPPGSTIWLEADAGEHVATITVRDDGPGIPPSDLDRLGERFYRGDMARGRHTGGAGLGLAIARAIMEAHGGTLAIASELGRGAMVTLRLPLIQPGMPASVPETVSRPGAE